MLIFALFCLLAVGSQAKPLEPAQHIVIVTPQAQVHLEPAVRYVHGLSPLARVAGPHHEETIVYVPAGTAASVVPTVADTVGTGRSRYGAPEGKQIENVPAGITQIQQQAQQGVEIVSGQFGEAAAAAAAAGAGFFPAFFPGGSAKEQEQQQQQLKTEKIELIETPANTQPLIATAEARHFYSLPQVYHTPVVDVVHTPVYTWPISTIRARSIQIEPKSAEPEPEAAPAPAAAPALAPAAPLAAEAAAPEVPPAQPLLKEQKLPEQAEQPLEQQQQTIIPAAIIEASESKAEIAGRQLEETNAIKQEQTIAEIPQAVKDSLRDPLKGQPIKELLKELPKEELPIKEEGKLLSEDHLKFNLTSLCSSLHRQTAAAAGAGATTTAEGRPYS